MGSGEDARGLDSSGAGPGGGCHFTLYLTAGGWTQVGQARVGGHFTFYLHTVVDEGEHGMRVMMGKICGGLPPLGHAEPLEPCPKPL